MSQYWAACFLMSLSAEILIQSTQHSLDRRCGKNRATRASEVSDRIDRLRGHSEDSENEV